MIIDDFSTSFVKGVLNNPKFKTAIQKHIGIGQSIDTQELDGEHTGLKDMYKRIIQNMNEQDIQIWDDIYPCEFFEEDIKNSLLYVLLNNDEIVAAFVLSNTNLGEMQ